MRKCLPSAFVAIQKSYIKSSFEIYQKATSFLCPEDLDDENTNFTCCRKLLFCTLSIKEIRINMPK